MFLNPFHGIIGLRLLFLVLLEHSVVFQLHRMRLLRLEEEKKKKER